MGLPKSGTRSHILEMSPDKSPPLLCDYFSLAEGVITQEGTWQKGWPHERGTTVLLFTCLPYILLSGYFGDCSYSQCVLVCQECNSVPQEARGVTV